LIQVNHNIGFKETYDDYFILSSSSYSLLLKGIEQFKELIVETNHVKIGDIYPTYKETVSQQSHQILSKSPNKWTRLFVRAKPLEKDDEIEKYPFGISYKCEKKHKYFVIRHGDNLFIDCTVGVYALREILSSISIGMRLFCDVGVLCQEVTGVKFILEDCNTHCDALRRGAGQIIPTTRRVLWGSELAGGPKLLEGLLNVHVIGKEEDIVKVVSMLKQRNGELEIGNTILSDETNNPMVNVHFKIGVTEFVELTAKFEEMKRSGVMISVYSYSNGEMIAIEGNPLEEGTKSNLVTTKIREMKGLTPKIPELDHYCDKL